jgi:hypothetical protein
VLIASIDRVQLMSLFSKGGVIAEVGVYRGGFAAAILRNAQPAKLHLIDPWAIDEQDEYLTSNRMKREQMLGAYDQVISMFGADIEAGRVEIHRTYSTQAADSFPDHYFDWVNIDAMHDYANVLADLRAYQDKVKPDGFILGHDFSNTRMGRVKNFGVIRAVRDFVASTEFELVLVTNEAAPSYLLARSGNDTMLPTLQEALLNLAACRLIEVDDTLLDHFEQVEVVLADGRKDQLMRFVSPSATPASTPPTLSSETVAPQVATASESHRPGRSWLVPALVLGAGAATLARRLRWRGRPDGAGGR